MIKFYWLLGAALLLNPEISCAQTSPATVTVNTVQPKIMVIPYTKAGEDLRIILEQDVNRRIALTKIKEGFDTRGFTTVDFVAKLKAAKDNQAFTSDNQTDIKTQIVEMSGCDIYVVAEVDAQKTSTGSSVNLVLSGYEASTGNSLSNKVGNSGKFYTDDFAKLSSKAVESCIEEFLNTMNAKFTDVVNNGKSVLVDISFADGSATNMETSVGTDQLPLSDDLEEWFGKNSVKNNYHIQGTTKLKMILDDVRIPLKDTNGNNFSSSKYALELFKHLRTLQLDPKKVVKGNTIYITIN
jgi:hypothetical protein